MTTVVVQAPVVLRTVTVQVPGPPGPRGPVPTFVRERFTLTGLGPYVLQYTPDEAFVQVLLDRVYDLDPQNYSISGKNLNLSGITTADYQVVVVRYTTQDTIA